MKFQTIQQSPKVSSAKLGMYCSLFCLGTGLVYGWLESMNYPVNSFGKGWMAFSTTLFWGGVVVAFLMFRKGMRPASLVLLAVYTVNISVSVYAVNNCELNADIEKLYAQQIESTNIHPSHRMLGDFFFPPPDYSPKFK